MAHPTPRAPVEEQLRNALSQGPPPIAPRFGRATDLEGEVVSGEEADRRRLLSTIRDSPEHGLDATPRAPEVGDTRGGFSRFLDALGDVVGGVSMTLGPRSGVGEGLGAAALMGLQAFGRQRGLERAGRVKGNELRRSQLKDERAAKERQLQRRVDLAKAKADELRRRAVVLRRQQQDKKADRLAAKADADEKFEIQKAQDQHRAAEDLHRSRTPEGQRERSQAITEGRLAGLGEAEIAELNPRLMSLLDDASRVVAATQRELSEAVNFSMDASVTGPLEQRLAVATEGQKLAAKTLVLDFLEGVQTERDLRKGTNLIRQHGLERDPEVIAAGDQAGARVEATREQVIGSPVSPE